MKKTELIAAIVDYNFESMVGDACYDAGMQYDVDLGDFDYGCKYRKLMEECFQEFMGSMQEFSYKILMQVYRNQDAGYDAVRAKIKEIVAHKLQAYVK